MSFPEFLSLSVESLIPLITVMLWFLVIVALSAALLFLTIRGAYMVSWHAHWGWNFLFVPMMASVILVAGTFIAWVLTKLYGA